jgi:XTP/dITP diphosphohydrolase
MQITFVTSNKSKVERAKGAVKALGITVKQQVMELSESRSEDPAEIALEKAMEAYARLKTPLIVEDSGFFIDGLGGFPMTHIKFSLKTLGIKKIMKMLEGEKNRKAEWRMTVAYVYGPRKFKSFTFIEKGLISEQIRKSKRPMMSDYWQIFIPKINNKNSLTLCELSDREFNEWEKHYDAKNQFKMFGEWFAKRK